jgi:hypothetical protein
MKVAVPSPSPHTRPAHAYALRLANRNEFPNISVGTQNQLLSCRDLLCIIALLYATHGRRHSVMKSQFQHALLYKEIPTLAHLQASFDPSQYIKTSAVAMKA